MLSCRFGLILVVVFLEKKIGTGGEKGVRWLLGGDHWNGMPIARVELAQEVEHLACLANGLADAAEGIGELLQAAGVGGDVHVALNKVAELSLQVDGTMKKVVTELLLDAVLDRVGSWLRHPNNGEDVLGDRVVDPAQNALIDDSPVRIMALRRGWGRGKVRAEAELADECVEERAPLGVVWIGELEHDGDVGLDVHGLKNRDGGSDDGGGEELAGGRGVGVGEVDMEEGVGLVVHSRGIAKSEEKWGAAEEGETGAAIAEVRRVTATTREKAQGETREADTM